MVEAENSCDSKSTYFSGWVHLPRDQLGARPSHESKWVIRGTWRWRPSNWLQTGRRLEVYRHFAESMLLQLRLSSCNVDSWGLMRDFSVPSAMEVSLEITWIWSTREKRGSQTGVDWQISYWAIIGVWYAEPLERVNAVNCWCIKSVHRVVFC